MGKRLYIRSSRRTFLQLCPATLAGLVASMRLPVSRNHMPEGVDIARAQRLPSTPSCRHTRLTPQQFEGPFYLCNSPERSSLLEPGVAGQKLVLTGQVLSIHCTPLKNALVDFWQADDRGDYDEDGYRLRGHQFTDETGHYRLETIVPGIYSGRTRHLHVNIQVPEQPFFTTQLFFSGEPLNESDPFFQSELSMETLAPSSDPDSILRASFTFVLAL